MSERKLGCGVVDSARRSVEIRSVTCKTLGGVGLLKGSFLAVHQVSFSTGIGSIVSSVSLMYTSSAR